MSDRTGFEFARQVETEYPLEQLVCRGRQVWPVLRHKYYIAADRRVASLNKTFSVKAGLRNTNRLLNLRHGFPSRWRKPYGAVLFTSGDIAKETPAGFLDKNAHWLALEAAKGGPFLTVEFPKTNRHMPARRLVSGERLSQDFWSLKAMLARPVAREECDGIEMLEEIQKRFDLQLADLKNLGALFALVDSIEKALRHWSPRLLVVNCYYSMIHQAAIMAATRLGIPSIETQHGLISPASASYTLFRRFERHALPDHLALWGEQSMPIFHPENHFIDKRNVHVIGNGFLEELATSAPTVPEWLREKCAAHQRVVCIASQEILDDEVLEFTSAAAKQDPDNLYIFLPRRGTKVYPDSWFTENFINAGAASFYDVVRLADIHATVYSTTALEAPALGVPNILLNIGGRSKEHLGKANLASTEIVDRPDEFRVLVQQWELPSKEEIRKGHQQVFALDHKKRIQECLATVFKTTACAT